MYPTLDSYIRSIIKDKYGTDDVEKACDIYMQKDFYPYLEKYDPEKYHPYPKLIEEQMGKNPIYKIKKKNGGFDGEEEAI